MILLGSFCDFVFLCLNSSCSITIENSKVYHICSSFHESMTCCVSMGTRSIISKIPYVVLDLSICTLGFEIYRSIGYSWSHTWYELNFLSLIFEDYCFLHGSFLSILINNSEFDTVFTGSDIPILLYRISFSWSFSFSEIKNKFFNFSMIRF